MKTFIQHILPAVLVITILLLLVIYFFIQMNGFDDFSKKSDAILIRNLVRLNLLAEKLNGAKNNRDQIKLALTSGHPLLTEIKAKGIQYENDLIIIQFPFMPMQVIPNLIYSPHGGCEIIKYLNKLGNVEYVHCYLIKDKWYHVDYDS